MSHSLTILAAAGGTGGDLFPAVAVIEELQALVPSLHVLWVGNPHRIEAKIIPQLGYDFYPISVTGYKGLRSLDSYMLPFRIVGSLLECRRLMREHNVAGVLCGGTYISYPAGMAAHQLKIPMMLLEPNVVPGKTNRLLAQKADAIILAFEETRRHFSEDYHKRMYPFGNPVRHTMNISLPQQSAARRALGLDESIPTVFVFGGSLGARSLNQAMLRFMDETLPSRVQVIWQTGRNFTPPSIVPPYIHIYEFIEDMATMYAAADLVVSRAGGGTVSELMNVGKPSVLVPLPTAANNEQWHNARVLEEHGAALMVEDSYIREKFTEILFSLLHDTERLGAMSRAAHAMAKPDASQKAAQQFLSLVQ